MPSLARLRLCSAGSQADDDALIDMSTPSNVVVVNPYSRAVMTAAANVDPFSPPPAAPPSAAFCLTRCCITRKSSCPSTPIAQILLFVTCLIWAVPEASAVVSAPLHVLPAPAPVAAGAPSTHATARSPAAADAAPSHTSTAAHALRRACIVAISPRSPTQHRTRGRGCRTGHCRRTSCACLSPWRASPHGRSLNPEPSAALRVRARLCCCHVD